METSNSAIVSTKQQRIAKLAYERKDGQIYSLNQYLDETWLMEAYKRTRKDGATGIDGVEAEEYGKNLSENIKGLITKAKTGLYRAPAVRRVYIPKAGSKTEKRPIGIPTYEDKILQRAVAMILEPIFEVHFKDSSYGFRPKRSQHQALKRIWKSVMKAGDCYIIEIDIKKYFDTIDKKILKQMISQRVQDGVILRLIGKWLKAGIMEDQRVRYEEKGTPQGGVISPMLSNLYLHHVLDEWFETQVKPRMAGFVDLIRFADDSIIICKNKRDAERIYQVLPQRFKRFGLELHPEKTRICRFSKPKQQNDDEQERDDDKFDFLGFTHRWGKSRKGNWIVVQNTEKKRFSRALKAISEWCRYNRHYSIAEQQRQLTQKIKGHYSYYGITGNSRKLALYFNEVSKLWHKWLRRRSNKYSLTWEKMELLLERYPLPKPKIVHSIYAVKL